MTKVLLTSNLTRDGIAYVSGNVVEFDEAATVAVVGGGAGTPNSAAVEYAILRGAAQYNHLARYIAERAAEAGRAELANGLIGVIPPFATPATMASWRKARALVHTGGATVARIAFVGDSKTVGAGAGTGANFTDGAFTKSRPARIAALLTQAGYTARQGFFGYSGLATPAIKALYDTRIAFGSAWTGGAATLGGVQMSQPNNASSLTFTPTEACDRFSLFYRGGADRPTFSIVKGAETVDVTPSGATNSFVRHEATFVTKDANPIAVTRTGGSGSLILTGGVAWDSALPYLEIANFGVYGVVSAYLVDSAQAYSPLPALQAYAPHLTFINLGTNDINTAVPMATWLANLQTIITVAKLSGSVVLEWPSVGGASPSFGADATRTIWRAAAEALAVANGCVFFDEESALGGRATAAAAGAFADAVHEVAWAYDIEAAPLAALILQ